MADFCNKCAEELGFGIPDIDVYEIHESLEPGFFESCLCEGCGMLGVAKSEHGELFVIHDDDEGNSTFSDYENYKGLKKDNNE